MSAEQKSAVGFTPGPWTAILHKDDVGEWFDISSTSSSEFVCNVDDEADARLIAAAPDLFDALAELLFEDSNKAEIARIITRCKARNALMKASEAPLRGSVPDEPAPPQDTPAPASSSPSLEP